MRCPELLGRSKVTTSRGSAAVSVGEIEQSRRVGPLVLPGEVGFGGSALLLDIGVPALLVELNHLFRNQSWGKRQVSHDAQHTLRSQPVE